MGASLDMERIAKKLGAERRGKVLPRGGYFGALGHEGYLAGGIDRPGSQALVFAPIKQHRPSIRAHPVRR